MIHSRIYPEPQLNKREILRYAGCGAGMPAMSKENCASIQPFSELEPLLEECLSLALPKLAYRVCFLELPVSICGSTCDFDCMQIQSQDLAKNLQGCEKAILFAATIGVEMDRLIAKYASISPAKAVMLQAIGAERIESLCNRFCQDVAGARGKLRPRFSPGYGDLPLGSQREILQLLEANRHIGISLNDSLLMAPSKSVTAFIGVQEVNK